MKRYGNRIAELRKKLSLTQDELAERLGITRASLSHYETGRREPDYDTLLKFADYFRVSLDYLAGRISEPDQNPMERAARFVEQLELSDDDLLDHFALTVDGHELTQDEARRFIAFIRAERAMRK